MPVVPAAEVAFHQLVKERDVLADGSGQLLGAAIPVGRGDTAHELAVIQRVIDVRAGERQQKAALDVLPQAEERGHSGDERAGLCAEDDRQRANGLTLAGGEGDLVLHRGAVFVLKRALERH